MIRSVLLKTMWMFLNSSSFWSFYILEAAVKHCIYSDDRHIYRFISVSLFDVLILASIVSIDSLTRCCSDFWCRSLQPYPCARFPSLPLQAWPVVGLTNVMDDEMWRRSPVQISSVPLPGPRAWISGSGSWWGASGSHSVWSETLFVVDKIHGRLNEYFVLWGRWNRRIGGRASAFHSTTSVLVFQHRGELPQWKQAAKTGGGKQPIYYLCLAVYSLIV